MKTLARPNQQEAFRFPKYEGLSADGYPDPDKLSVPNGTEFYQIDTGKTYKYDEENDQWYEMPTGGGGGASSWSELTGKPFETIGDGLEVNADNELVNSAYAAQFKDWEEDD